MTNSLDATQQELTKIHCAFCDKNGMEVSILIVRNDTYICDKCVEICHQMLLEKKNERQNAN